MKKFLPVVWVAVIVLALFGMRTFYVAEVEEKSKDNTTSVSSLTYTIEGNPVLLQNGVAVTDMVAGVGGSRERIKVTTRYIKTDAVGDLNDDGISDNVVLLLQEGDGSKQLYYIAVARGIPEGYEGTNGVFLGDSIEYHIAEIRGGEIVVHYRGRLPTESMDTKPHMGIAKYFALRDDILTQIQKSDPLSEGGIACRKNGGIWSSEFKECTGISESTCVAFGGVFTLCASACRNSKESNAVCTLQCVPVCALTR